MATGAALAEVLGLETKEVGRLSLLGLVGEIERGLPLSALDRLVHSLSPQDGSFAHRLVPRATLARRRKGGEGALRLSPEEGAKVARLAEVWAFALDVWGSEEEARDFLFREHPLLDMRRPVDVVLASEFGRPLVEGILGRLKYGLAV
ncbi:antitoxin Xre-like helix-turn-helix domain-containing protein [Belnapia rosea]|uniref:Putative toxin-antitoxin system antitoxin component, TIGR02293 family n=1 Tax=Belnapia rosea TaxID=938405 RepID=A0A1G7E149_9PROT|nr:antitoxin Xre-like helix-turn-helix domain-containing protein [Belnapia rosea]SDE57428.1 putative toxin-antitoxin system antitoxin component, TIGR02293 family [Belnapia rosea]